MVESEAEPDAYPVLPENWLAVSAFCALSTQWRCAGAAGVRVGLDYSSIESTLRLMGREATPALFADLRAMEAEALAVFAEKQKRA